MAGAICSICKKDMLAIPGCIVAGYKTQDGVTHNAIPFMDDIEYHGLSDEFRKLDQQLGTEARCHDCGAHPGQYHHTGCDVERCPVCRNGAQAIGCSHLDDAQLMKKARRTK